MRSGAKPTALASRRRFAITVSRSSPVRIPRLSAAKGASLTPPRRVVKTAVAPGIFASSQRSPSASRHSIVTPRRFESDRQLLVRPGDLAIELATQRLLQPPPQRRALLEAGLNQVGAIDLEGDVAPLAQIAIEPLSAENPSEDELGAVAGSGEGDGLGRASGLRRGQGLLATRRADRGGEQRAIAGRQSAPRLVLEQLGRARDQLGPARAQLDQTPLGEQRQGSSGAPFPRQAQ